MSTEAQLKAISNSELASGNQIPALKHRTVNNAIIEEMYDAQSRGDVLAGVQTAVSIASGDQVLVIRSGQAYLLDSSEFGFVDALADLTDVIIPTPANDQVLAYNTSTSKWVAKDVNTLTSVVSISGTATTNALTKFTGTSSIGNSILSDDGTTVTIAGDLSVNNDLTVGTINSGTSSDFVKGDGSLDSTTYQDTSEKDQANGYAPLDSGAKIPLANLPDSILGQVSYQGTWAASTNTPTLANPPASTTKGEYYVTSVAGTQFSIDFQVGDWIISNGTSWEKVDNTDAVTSVFGRLGNIVANESDYASFYVDFDSDQSITGQKTFGSGDLRIVSGGSGNLPTIFINSSVGSSTESGFNSLGFNGSNDFYFTKGVGASFNGAIFSYDNAAIRTYTLQDASGTLAFTSDINDTLDSVTDRGATTTNAITVGGATINGNLTVDTNTLFVDSANNNVGIGTSDIEETLTIAKTDGGDGTIVGLRSDASFSQFEIETKESQLSWGFNAVGGRNIYFTTNSTERMRIESDGDITLGSATNYAFIRGWEATTGNMVIGADQTATGVGGSNLIFRTRGTERMRIDSSGNVGIGTSSPSANLEVYKSDFPALRLSNANAFSNIYQDPSGVINYSSDDGATAASSGHIFYVDGSERMRIDSSGNVGIGTTSPVYNLDVAGEIGIDSYLRHNGDTDTFFGFSGADTIKFRTAGTDRLTIDSSGNLILDPNGNGAAYLQLNTLAGGDGHILLQRGGSNKFQITSDISDGLTFYNYTAGSESMRIDSSGNVGINCSPATGVKLQVNGDGSIFRLDGTANTSRGMLIRNVGTATAEIKTDGNLDFNIEDAGRTMRFLNGNTERMRIDSSGNVGIGTSSPSAKLDVDGQARSNAFLFRTVGGTDTGFMGGRSDWTGGATNNDLAIGTYQPNMCFFTNNNGTERMRIDSSGNVGIGTSSPSFQLQLSTDSAAKPTSALWTIASDARIKENIEPYTKGLDELMLINPITYDYNGLGGYEKGKGGVGIIAQEIKDVLPDSVSSVKAKLNEDDEEETDILNFNGHELTYVLINSIKELRAEIETLKQQINGQ